MVLSTGHRGNQSTVLIYFLPSFLISTLVPSLFTLSPSLFLDRVSCGSDYPQTDYIAYTGLELLFFLFPFGEF